MIFRFKDQLCLSKMISLMLSFRLLSVMFTMFRSDFSSFDFRIFIPYFPPYELVLKAGSSSTAILLLARFFRINSTRPTTRMIPTIDTTTAIIITLVLLLLLEDELLSSVVEGVTGIT